MLHFGVISAGLTGDWHSERLIAACRSLGDVRVVAPQEFGLRAGPNGLTVLAAGRDAREVDVWLAPRALGPVGDHDVQLTIYRTLAELGPPIVNPVGALLDAEDKIRTSVVLAQAGVPTPEIVAVQSLEEGMRALAGLGVAVAKPPYGSLGIDVVRLTARDRPAREAARGALAELLARHRVIYLQRFVGNLRRPRDLRLFVVGGQVKGALARLAPPGEFRTNIHQGGQPQRITPGPELAEVAIRATRALGLEYGGVDLIETPDGPTVLEVNGTPRWEGILEATGRDMAAEVAAHAAALARGTARRRARPARGVRARRAA